MKIYENEPTMCSEWPVIVIRKYVVTYFCDFSSECGGVLDHRVVTAVIIHPSAMSNDSLAMPWTILNIHNGVIAAQSRTQSARQLVARVVHAGALPLILLSEPISYTVQPAITSFRNIKMS